MYGRVRVVGSDLSGRGSVGSSGVLVLVGRVSSALMAMMAGGATRTWCANGSIDGGCRGLYGGVHVFYVIAD